jgi:O-antigen/teichoic acid export membrane protein
VFPFLLLPVLTRYLTPTEYGTFVMFQVVVNFVLPLIGLNAEAAVSKAYFDLEERELARYISTTCSVTLLGAAALLLATLVIGRSIGRFLDFPQLWIAMAVIVAAGESVKAVLLALWQMQKRSRRYTAFTVLQTVLRFTACLIAVLYAHNKLSGLLWGYSLSLLAFATYCLVALVRLGDLRLLWDSHHVAAFLHYGLPLVPHRMSGWLTGMADRVIIARLTNLGEVGIYSVGYSIGAAVALLQDAFNRAWVPFFFERLKRGDSRSLLQIVRFIYLYAFAMVGAAALVTLLAPLVFPLLGAQFAAARVFVVWIAFAYAVNGIYKMFANFLFFSDRTSFLSYITVSTGLLTIGVTIPLVGATGVLGAAYGAVLGQILACIAVWLVVRAMFPMPWSGAVSEGVIGWRRRRTGGTGA